jgi:tetratricopeptide (TPR) repeat protein
MKKSRRQAPAESAGSKLPTKAARAVPGPAPRSWWPWAAALGALFVIFEAYAPALKGPFVLDDLYLPFANPRIAEVPFLPWIRGVRPLLMTSYWLNYQWNGTDPYSYHATNVFLHFLVSVTVVLICARLLDWAGVAGKLRYTLAAFAGGLFLLHPIQTESVAYVASRSENLSVLCFYAAFAIFLYRNTESITWLRSLAIVALFGAAVSTKEHTLTLPALLILTDLFWRRGGLRKNAILYGMLAVAAVIGGIGVWRLLTTADTAGFRVEGMTPWTYFFTQGRVIWMYLRFAILPFGQNVDPDIAVSQTLLDHGAIFGFLALIALAAAAWIFRKRWPLAAFGFFVFLLLLAPTSSVVPIRDVLAERRLYLPFLGLALASLEALRHLKLSHAAWIGVAVLTACSVATYKRNQVWGDPLALWKDSVAKSPNKVRPRFQVAYLYYQMGQCPQAAENYEIASRLGPPDLPLLLDWALALDCAGHSDEAIAKLRQAAQLENSAHVHAQIGMVYAKQNKMSEALSELAQAEKLNPLFEMTYVYRGGIYELAGDRTAAAREYQRAVTLNPSNQTARDSLVRVNR